MRNNIKKIRERHSINIILKEDKDGVTVPIIFQFHKVQLRVECKQPILLFFFISIP